MEILKEENASLRRELDQYHLETRKLKKVLLLHTLCIIISKLNPFTEVEIILVK